MRIALLSSQFPGVRLGGIGAYSLQNARALAGAGHEPHLFTLPLPEDARARVPAGVVLHEVTIPTAGVAPVACAELHYRLSQADAFAGHVLAAHARAPFDLVEGPEYEAPGLGLMQSDIPLVTHLHSGSAISREVGNVGESAEQAMREALELELLAGSDALCAPSDAVVKDTFHAYGLGGPPWAAGVKILRLPFDVPEVPFTEPAPEAPVLYIGRLERLKGAHLLAEAAAEFLDARPEATLRVAGPDTMTAPGTGGSMAEWMRQKLSHVKSQVAFLGELSVDQIRAELAGCSFVVVPSLRESYSYVCCEALAAGRPVLVSSDIGATQVVGEGGLAFRRGDAKDLAQRMALLWQDTELTRKLARVAYDRARTILGSTQTTPARIAFYQQVLARCQHGGIGRPADRLAALPRQYATRSAAARALAGGELDRAIRLLEASGVAWDADKVATPGTRLLQRLAGHPKSHGSGLHFYLYGAGRHTERLLQEQSRWESQGHRCIGILDDHPRFAASPTFRGLAVLSLAQASRKLGLGDIVVLSTDAFEDQFWSQSAPLRGRGVTVYRLYGT